MNSNLLFPSLALSFRNARAHRAPVSIFSMALAALLFCVQCPEAYAAFQPDIFTVQASGVDGLTGTALVEVY